MKPPPSTSNAMLRRPLRVLLSAYACEPHKGSEPGVGWHWAQALVAAGHDVCVITRANNRPAIERALAGNPVGSLRFAYYDLPGWAAWWKRGGRCVHLYYVLWQWGAFCLARALSRETRFDVAHHITFGVFRHPSFMALLDVPFVFGPVGGGERAPRRLRASFPVTGYLTDLARDAANAVVRFDPLMTLVFRRSAAVLCKTHETLTRIPRRHRGKCRIQLEIGTDGTAPLPAPRVRDAAGLRVLYVGRLLYWKGLHLGLHAFAQLLAFDPDARLTVIGSGPNERWLRGISHDAGIDAAVTWVPWLERADVLRAYSRHDVLLFPSLHDSSGNAVLEALSCGLPVVCLDAGGPGVLVDPSCGFKVNPTSVEQVVSDLSRALTALARDPALAEAMGRAAACRAREEFSWARQAERMGRLYGALCTAADRHDGATALAMSGEQH
ncbi:MAG TPA: glycosyltransferase family 4 protein [Burkholderiales bacterium]|nr:glycosyltransferase family 4 protein [Burkholderiales bacterium]